MESSNSQAQSNEAETPGQKQARLRRERREAKIKAEGTSRLEKITKVSGRQNLPDPTPPPLAPNTRAHTADPEEVDLSTHPSASRTPNLQNAAGAGAGAGAQPTEADIRTLLRAGASPTPIIDTHPGQAGAEEDPMMKMISQLMGGGMPGAEGTVGGDEGLPPALAAMLGGTAGAAGAQTQQAPVSDMYDYVWKIVHSLFALMLGVYVTTTSTALVGPVVRIPGKVLSGDTPTNDGIDLFWAFATAELVLQSSRYFLERGRTGSQLGGWMGMAIGLLPEPYRTYIRLVGRYSGIWNTIVEDGMVLVFVVGVFSWWKGAVG
ncbi:MAG: hypothetical protein Q9217_002708 [Psora testacea]